MRFRITREGRVGNAPAPTASYEFDLHGSATPAEAIAEATSLLEKSHWAGIFHSDLKPGQTLTVECLPSIV